MRTAGLELSLAHSKHSVEIVAKDEEIRKLCVARCVMQAEMDEVQAELDDEMARADGLEGALEEALQSRDQFQAEAEALQSQCRTQAREVANLKVGSRLSSVLTHRIYTELSLTRKTPQAELKAMENLTADSDKILSEKLALTREMASLRPEVEHLRAQVNANQGLLAEKLSLQRQLFALQVELDNEKRASARAAAKQGKKAEQDDELRAEIEEVRRELAKEKKDRIKAENAVAKAEQRTEQAQADLESQQQATERIQAKVDKSGKQETAKASKRDQARELELEQLRQELEQERAARKAAEKARQDNAARDAEIEALRKELEQEKRERQRAEKASKKGGQQADPQTDQLRRELDEERRERKAAEKEYSKTLAELQGRNTILDDKLTAFRDKLRSTKEKLKEKEAELERAQSVAPSVRATTELARPTKNPRKRVAETAEPTNLGTPGGGFPAKRMKRATSVSVADTSAFSLTPFLQGKSSLAATSMILEEDEDDDAEADDAAAATPTAPPKKMSKKTAQPKAQALAPSESKKVNAKPAPRRKAAAPALAMVTEEASEFSSKESVENATTSVPLKNADDGAPDKPRARTMKQRKSLMSFVAFTDEPSAEIKKKKKRRLGAGSSSGLGKTLFDAEEDALPVKPIGGKGIFAARALGKLAKGPSRPISGGYNMMSEEQFSFSPLKRDRKNLSMLKD